MLKGLNLFQRLILAAGLLAMAASLVYVPYEAEASREGDNYKTNLGYSFIWAPPSENDCADLFNVSWRRCDVRPAISQAAITAIAIAIGTAGIWLLTGLLPIRSKPSDTSPKIPGAPTGVLVQVPPAEPAQNRSLADMLHDDLGAEFPVRSGNAKSNDPLVINAKTDYVSVEYAVVRHVLGAVREEYKLYQQRLHRDGDRHIDELVFDVKPSGSEDWTGQRRFFFDITDGFNGLST